MSHVHTGTYSSYPLFSQEFTPDPGRVSEPEPPGAGVFGWSQSRHFGPAPAPP